MILRQYPINLPLICVISCLFRLLECSSIASQVIYAVNCGGDSHTDTNGIRYEKDPLYGRIGIASDFGKRLAIGRVPINDHILYQTERYHTNTFGYDIPINSDGDYVLVLKFCEVYFNAPNQKVFDVVLNGDHVVVSDLDIYEKVGRGVAHDEHVRFIVSNGRLFVKNEESEIRAGKIRVEFIKGYRDNPKINAMYVIKGRLDDVPLLQPFDVEQETTEEPEEEVEPAFRHHKPSGPALPDPWIDDTSFILPIFLAFGAFVPLLFCFCKL